VRAVPAGDYEEYPVSQHFGKRWAVLDSIEHSEGNRCVDLFVRPDNTYGFEEFRKEPEDAGAWTPVRYHSTQSYSSKREALKAARNCVTWLSL
jgi:hypothetical protein